MAITTINSLAIPAGTVVSADLTYPLTGFSSTGIDDNATSTAITIDSSENVGIGTTSPNKRLEISNGSNISYTVDVTAGNYVGLSAYDYLNSTYEVLGTNGSILTFNTGSGASVTEAMRIDPNGWVNPNANTTSNPADSQGLHLGWNLSNGGGESLIVFNQGAGATGGLVFSDNSTNGTPVERMRINSSGNVGIGTTSPAYKLDIYGSSTTNIDLLHLLNSNNTLGCSSSIMFENYSGGGLNQGRIKYLNAGSNNSNSFVFEQEINATNGLVETMRIDSSGNVGIGTSSPALNVSYNKIMHVHSAAGLGSLVKVTDSSTGFTTNDGSDFLQYGADLYILNRENGTMRFSTNSTERMRIDSSGNLLVGTTSSVTTGSEGIELRGDFGYFKTARNNTGSTGHWLIYNPNGNVGSVTTSGTSTQYNTSSDVRLKENIVDAPAGNIDAIRVRSFDWKADGSHQTYGMVAQELVDVAPEAVVQGETEDDMWGVDYSKLVPMMIKEIQDLKAEVAALKGA